MSNCPYVDGYGMDKLTCNDEGCPARGVLEMEALDLEVGCVLCIEQDRAKIFVVRVQDSVACEQAFV
jgi:hypothetical protein